MQRPLDRMSLSEGTPGRNDSVMVRSALTSAITCLQSAQPLVAEATADTALIAGMGLDAGPQRLRGADAYGLMREMSMFAHAVSFLAPAWACTVRRRFSPLAASVG